jgi:Circadian oscillating protein COP23
MMNTLKSALSFFSVPIIFGNILSLGIAPSLAQPKKDITVFACIQQGENYATVAKRANRTTPPLIIWKDKSFGDKYPPKKRCEIVSSKLSKAVVEQGGRLKTLKLTHGKVGKNSVICYISHPTSRCDEKNTLLTLNKEDIGKEKALIEQLVSLKVTEEPLSRSVSRSSDGSPENRTMASFDEIDKSLSTDTVPETPATPSPTTPSPTTPNPTTPGVTQ